MKQLNPEPMLEFRQRLYTTLAAIALHRHNNPEALLNADQVSTILRELILEFEDSLQKAKKPIHKTMQPSSL